MAKRRYGKRALPTRAGEQATKERRRQMAGVVTEVVERDLRGNAFQKRDRARVECTLDAYRLRGYLTEAEFEAGMKFRRAYLRAVFRMKVEDPSSSAEYDPQMALLMVPISEEMLRDAYEAMSQAQRIVVIAVCGHDQWAGNTDRIETLHRGLERLVGLWKLG